MVFEHMLVHSPFWPGLARSVTWAKPTGQEGVKRATRTVPGGSHRRAHAWNGRGGETPTSAPATGQVQVLDPRNPHYNRTSGLVAGEFMLNCREEKGDILLMMERAGSAVTVVSSGGSASSSGCSQPSQESSRVRVSKRPAWLERAPRPLREEAGGIGMTVWPYGIIARKPGVEQRDLGGDASHAKVAPRKSR